MLRAALLGAADNRRLQRFVTRHGLNLGARRFVAGESLEELLGVVRTLNDRGFSVACGLLGEGIRSVEDARDVVHQYEAVLTRIAEQRLRANVALKLTHLGLAIGSDTALENLSSIVASAARSRNFIRIDMEQSAYVDATLDLYRTLRRQGHPNVGTVLQSYLYRSENDLRSLLPFAPNLRIVKGAYLEPVRVAFRKKIDVDKNFTNLMELSLLEGGFTAIATHDEKIIERAVAFARAHDIGSDRFEFQMLYGVRPRLQADLLRRGFPVRVAVPFGSHWYQYLMRRLAERPANLGFFLRNLWR
jgi:proline dehydrogenase